MVRVSLSKKIAILIFVYLGIVGIVPVISSAMPDDNVARLSMGSDINASNITLANGSVHSEYMPTREPVKLQLELNQTTLPGPRYMAFGPSVIGIWIDPLVLGAGVVVLAGLGIVYVIRRKSRNQRDMRDPVEDTVEEPGKK